MSYGGAGPREPQRSAGAGSAGAGVGFEIRPSGSLVEFRDAVNAISHYFGNENSDEHA